MTRPWVATCKKRTATALVGTRTYGPFEDRRAAERWLRHEHQPFCPDQRSGRSGSLGHQVQGLTRPVKRARPK